MILDRVRDALLILSLSNLCLTQDPGQPWTDEETRIVRDKIRFIITDKESVFNEFFSLYPDHMFLSDPHFQHDDGIHLNATFPNAPKLLRLGFHDCIPYKDAPSDTPNGCDGCLDFEGMGKNMLKENQDVGMDTVLERGGGRTNNNGLYATAEILEEIYTNPTFPTGAQTMEQSLRDLGKSRADLWAFAAMVATEWGLENHNKGCDGEQLFDPGNMFAVEPNCKMTMPRSLRFLSGRIDCIPEPDLPRPYLTSRPESHPKPGANGPDTLDFYNSHFGWFQKDPALPIALHGAAHSFGEFGDTVSTFRYFWTRKQSFLLNHQFMKAMAGKPQYYPNGRSKDDFQVMGDLYGNPGRTIWRCKIIRGQFQLFHLIERCDTDANDCANLANLMENPGDGRNGCCKNREEGMMCNPSCVVDPYELGSDQETAILADVGFFLHFEVNQTTGRPYDCPVFDNDPRWTGPHTNNKRVQPVLDCGREMAEYQGKALSQVVEDLANDENYWLERFFTALEWMLQNGYWKIKVGNGKKFPRLTEPQTGWFQL